MAGVGLGGKATVHATRPEGPADPTALLASSHLRAEARGRHLGGETLRPTQSLGARRPMVPRSAPVGLARDPLLRGYFWTRMCVLGVDSPEGNVALREVPAHQAPEPGRTRHCGAPASAPSTPSRRGLVSLCGRWGGCRTGS